MPTAIMAFVSLAQHGDRGQRDQGLGEGEHYVDAAHQNPLRPAAAHIRDEPSQQSRRSEIYRPR